MIQGKKILVTAGSTNVPIDRVRCISNIFRGGTGRKIAEYLSEDHYVTLVTSDTEVREDRKSLSTLRFKTFDDLYNLMRKEITNAGYHYDAIIHSAAVSDYKVEEVCIKTEGGKVVPINSSGKVSSEHKDIFLHLVQTEKIIDLIRSPWNFEGYLVKFKLQVDISDEELIRIADKSRIASQADMIVANCLEWFTERGYIITDQNTERTSRREIPIKIHDELQRIWRSEK